MSVKTNIKSLLKEIPDHVSVLAAAKTRSTQEIRETVEAGVNIIGENYIQEMGSRVTALEDINDQIEWHMIGHLQTNKINIAFQYCLCF